MRGQESEDSIRENPVEEVGTSADSQGSVATKPRPETPKYWRRWDGKMYEYIGRDANNDGLMQPLEGGELVTISLRAMGSTWVSKWPSTCCDRWLNYDPYTIFGDTCRCYHGGPEDMKPHIPYLLERQDIQR